MLAETRQNKLNPILEALRELPGVKSVWQDDYNTVAIDVFVELDDCDSKGGSFDGRKPFRFAVDLRTIKRRIMEVCADFGPIMLDWPELKYLTIGGQKVRDGYDKDTIKVEVFI
tara:strand:- start:128 stop:469 length:342 start_codon:yes stop_codon:yes gene_type:complete